jgi:heparan-sulfate lyase
MPSRPQFLHAPAFTPRDLVLFLNACWEHAAFLADGREFHDNNWGLMEAEGVAFIAVTFPEFTRSQAWQTQAMAFLAAQIHLQVRPDGHHKEQCLSYHGGCINWFANTAKLAKLNGKGDAFPPAFWQRLEQMCAVFVKLGLPDGTTTQFGDDHSGNNWMNTLKAWSEVFHRDDFRFLATAGAAGMAPKETAFALKESGFYAFRSGWNRDAVCLVLKNGPDGGWHCQPDNGTFELYAAGRRLMPDSGAYIYTGDAAAVALRTWFRHRHGDDYSSIMSSQ